MLAQMVLKTGFVGAYDITVNQGNHTYARNVVEDSPVNVVAADVSPHTFGPYGKSAPTHIGGYGSRAQGPKNLAFAPIMPDKKHMQLHKSAGLLVALLFLSFARLPGQDLADVAKIYRPRLETNLSENIVAFWYPKTLDRTNGGYMLNHDIEGRLKGPGTKMIVTQARMVWFYSHLVRTGHGGQEYLDAADVGYRFLKEKMWDQKNGGFFWEVDVTGEKSCYRNKHLYGQSFALYALSEYYLATGKQEALDLATQLFNVMEAKAHDKIYGGYLEWFNEDWTPAPPGETTYMGEPDFKLMNTHLHLLEAMTTFYRASKLPLARERLLELIAIQSNAVVRKGLGACTDKYQRNWEPVLTGNYARVSYGHDLENIWLLNDACDAAGISNYPLLDLYRALFDYALKYGYRRRPWRFLLLWPVQSTRPEP